ncbi:GDP-mannose transporter gonst2 [Turnera subulata]|uniref:GDP-mannose transporter gonst2 n=1 Tax=Turnera subulata TaxID=218843 RepID=A0A9Q0FPZ1_9ROSI|nr:GDP-mannose transporter gonst2 [Turnera subulata]
MSDFKLNVVVPEEDYDDIHKQGKRSNGNFVAMAVGDRFSRGKQDEEDSDRLGLSAHENQKREHGSGRKLSGPLISGAAYCLSSCSMILLNKVVLSTYNFNAGISLMFYQNLISCLVVAILNLCGAVSVEKLNWKLVRVWLPVNAIFVGMLVSGMYSLKYINVAMVTILKNVTNIFTAIGELYIFRKHQNQKVWTAMFLMVYDLPFTSFMKTIVCIAKNEVSEKIISAITSGVTDLSFDATGYGWQFMNCILTASYSLTLRLVMDKAKQLTRTGSINEVSMVLLNNFLSLPFGILLIILFDEWEYLINTDIIKLPMFWFVATASGLLGLAISFTSMWFLRQTGPTTYSLVGSLNKIPISIAGLVLFRVPLSLSNFFSILFGLFAGIVFARAKMS